MDDFEGSFNMLDDETYLLVHKTANCVTMPLSPFSAKSAGFLLPFGNGFHNLPHHLAHVFHLEKFEKIAEPGLKICHNTSKVEFRFTIRSD